MVGISALHHTPYPQAKSGARNYMEQKFALMQAGRKAQILFLTHAGQYQKKGALENFSYLIST